MAGSLARCHVWKVSDSLRFPFEMRPFVFGPSPTCRLVWKVFNSDVHMSSVCSHNIIGNECIPRFYSYFTLVDSQPFIKAMPDDASARQAASMSNTYSSYLAYICMYVSK